MEVRVNVPGRPSLYGLGFSFGSPVALPLLILRLIERYTLDINTSVAHTSNTSMRLPALRQ